MGRALAFANYTNAMGVIDQRPRVKPLSQSEKSGQWSDVAIHGEYTVGQNHRVPVSGAVCGQDFLKMPEVVVTEFSHCRARQLCTCVQAGMCQFVNENEVALPDQRRRDGKIGQITRTKNKPNDAAGFLPVYTKYRYVPQKYTKQNKKLVCAL